MDIKMVVVASFLILASASVSDSRQDPPPGPGSNNPQSLNRASNGYPAPPGDSYAHPRPGGTPNGALRQGYTDQVRQGFRNRYPGTFQNQVPVGTSQRAHPYGREPTYPYSRHHNPYYKGQSIEDVFGGAIDWIVSVPGVLANGVTRFLDNRVFPQVPATQGGPSRKNENSSESGIDRSPTVKPLPQAENHRPNWR
jgi:hypothetical protein